MEGKREWEDTPKQYKLRNQTRTRCTESYRMGIRMPPSGQPITPIVIPRPGIIDQLLCGGTCLLRFKSLTWHEKDSYFSRFILRFNDAMLLVVNDVSVVNEMLMVISLISIFAGPTRLFEGVHRNRVCTRAFIGVSVRSCMWAFTSITGFAKKIQAP